MDTDAKTLYPSRYYAATDKPGWYDTWSLDSLDHVPAVSNLLALTEDEWISNRGTSKIGKNGKLVDYVTPAPDIPLPTQAAAELKNARVTVWNEYGALNEPTPDTWVAYLKALMAIANGTDTTSTALPAAPS